MLDLIENIYILKQEHGQSVDIYKRTYVTNVTTGKKIVTRRRITIRKAVILPVSDIVSTNYNRSTRGGNVPGNVGGYLETADCVVVIDVLDLIEYNKSTNKRTLFVVDEQDYVVIKDEINISNKDIAEMRKSRKRYEITSIEKIKNSVLLLTLKETEGTEISEVIDVNVKLNIDFQDLVVLV